MDFPIFAVAVVVLLVVVLFMAVRIVPQSQKLVVERIGQFHTVLKPGLNLIFPFIDRVAHTVDVLERQLEERPIDVITKDNVQVRVTVSTFFRVTRPEYTVYRIRNIDEAVQTAVVGVTRSSIGRVDFDELQSGREGLSTELRKDLEKIALDWGVEVTRSEIVDVAVDDETRRAMQQQLNAERERRATVTRAEGERRAVELRAEGDLFAATKEAEAEKIAADARAYATRTVSTAIKEGGLDAVRFEIAVRQIDAYARMANGTGTRTIILPNDSHQAFSGFMAAAALLNDKKADAS